MKKSSEHVWGPTRILTKIGLVEGFGPKPSPNLSFCLPVPGFPEKRPLKTGYFDAPKTLKTDDEQG